MLTQSNPLADGTTFPTQFPIGGPPVGIDFLAEHVSSGTLGDFTHNFSDDFKTIFNPTTIAEPASWALGMIAIVILSGFGFISKRGTRR